jgi:hypothetical protein
MLLSSPPVDKRGPHLTRMTPTLSPADARPPADTSILSARYRATTIGMVALVALHAFEALAVAAAMPPWPRRRMACACMRWPLAAPWPPV